MQSALILIAPAFFAASIYMELGRIIRLLNAEKSSVIKLNWLTKTFVMGDVLSFLMQASGMHISQIFARGVLDWLSAYILPPPIPDANGPMRL